MQLVLPISTAEAASKLLLIAIKLYVSLLPLSLIQFILSARISNIIYSVAVGIILTFICLILYGPNTVYWFPYAYPSAAIMSEIAPAATPSGRNYKLEQSTDINYRAPKDAFAGVSPDAERETILVDEVHGNRHRLGTIDDPGTLRWLIAPAEEARIEVKGSTAVINPEIFVKTSLLVIAGVAPSGGDAEVGAFSESEIEAVTDWVRKGGSLLLLTDHDPFGKPSRSLAQSLGVEFTFDVVIVPELNDPREPDAARLVFTKSAGLIEAHEITKGVERVITYGGQGIGRTGADTADLLKILPSVQTLEGKSVLFRESGAWAQLIAFPFGKGRVVVSGETALFTAQLKEDGSTVGLGDKGTDNERLVINSFRWLLRR